MMVAKYRNILVAVDGSEQADQALKEAVDIAKRNEAYLRVLTVSRAADAYESPYLFEQSDISSKYVLKNVEKIILDKVFYGFIILSGNPKSTIVKYAKEEKIDLIIMGATGNGTINLALVGSTTAYVVNQAPCNVLVVR